MDQIGPDKVSLGDAVLTRVVELKVELRTGLFASTPDSAWAGLGSDFYLPEPQLWRIAMQTWVIDVDGLTVVVDTGAGNDRDRPHMPPLDHLSTDFLAALERAEVDVSSVDVVINTHLHSDHVGWNTQLFGDSWVPTFPNARYLAPAADYDFFTGAGAEAPGMAAVLADSVFPVSDQLELWRDSYELSPSLHLRSAPGHTPGSSVLWLDAGALTVFVGDLTHSPLQLARPDEACAFDVDAAAAAVTRRELFSDAARLGAYVVPSHYPGRGGVRLSADGAPADWLELPPI